MTHTHRPEDRSEDGAVRAFLWRLRARLVTPPSETQVRSDLDRLLAVAREQAHVAPSADASATPGPAPVGGRPDQRLVTMGQPPAATDAPTEVAGGDELARRRLAGLARQLSRGVAAGVAVLLVGVGVSSATDGPVTIQALLGREVTPSIDPAPAPADPVLDEDALLAGPEVVDDGPDAGADAAPPERDDDPAVPDVEVEEPPTGDEDPAGDDRSADDGSRGGSQGQPSDTPADGSSNGSSGADSSAGSSSGSTGSSGSAGTSNGSGSSSGSGSTGSSDDDPSGSDGTSGSDGSGERQPEDGIGEEVIAAPPPTGSLDGFGSGSRCDGDLEDDCIDDGREGGPLTDDATREAVSAEELADRRFRPEE